MLLNEIIVKPVVDFFKDTITQVREINKKYATPHIKTSRLVKFSLIMLRVYLIFLVGMLFYKFYITVKG